MKSRKTCRGHKLVHRSMVQPINKNDGPHHSGNNELDIPAVCAATIQLERYKRDVLDLHPQWVSICIGINDVWRQFDSPAIPDEAVSPEEYERNLRSMIESAAAVAKGVILATPYYMEPNRTDFMRARMQEYVDICAKLAKEYKCIFVDFQSMYDRYFAYKHSSLIAWDRVHPNQIGATLMAKEWLAACGFDYNHVPGNG